LPQSDLSINAKQEINSRVALKMARENGYTWIGHIDSDELIHAPGGFGKAIAAIPTNVQVAKFSVLEAIPEKLMVHSAFKELCYFKHAPVVLPKNKSIYLDPRELFPFFLHAIQYRSKKIWAGLQGCNFVLKDYIKGHSLGKSLARTTSSIMSFRSHFPIPANQARLQINLLPGVFLLHYDSPDYERWKTKWAIRVKHVQNGVIPMVLSRRRQKQYDMFVNIFKHGNEQDLVELYRSTFFISPSDRGILQKSGLVSEIHLPDELFRSASDHARSGSLHA
jgi:hypothetical protein